MNDPRKELVVNMYGLSWVMGVVAADDDFDETPIVFFS